MLMFDGTSPHQAPGVMRSEGGGGVRQEGRADPRGRAGGRVEAAPGAWHPAFSPEGDLLIGHGGKRVGGGKGAKRARPEEGEPEEAGPEEAGSS
eukprot:6049925-Prymnesium_polylepis.1